MNKGVAASSAKSVQNIIVLMSFITLKLLVLAYMAGSVGLWLNLAYMAGSRPDFQSMKTDFPS